VAGDILTLEEKEARRLARNARARARYAALSSEERAKRKQAQAVRYLALSLEDRERRRRANTVRKRERRAALSPEEREAQNAELRTPDMRALRAAWARARYARNPERSRAVTIAYRRRRGRDAVRAWRRASWERRREKISAVRRTPEERAKRMARERKRRAGNLQWRLTVTVQTALRRAIIAPAASKRRSPLDGLGYTAADLRRHLEFQFTKGMNWGNYGRGDGKWNIDHRRPISSFRFTSVEDAEFKECWSLPNLQPLWESENQAKGTSRDLLL
jgi:hypothetical protein